MKPWILLLFVIGLVTPIIAQNHFEVKVNPILPLVAPPLSLAISTEYAVNKYVGSEFTATFLRARGLNRDEQRVHYNLSGKYYFKPRIGFDNFYAGGFVGYLTREGLKDGTYGLFIGQKWVSRHNIVIEIGSGLGRSIDLASYGYLPFARVYIGYRFTGITPKKGKNYVED